MKQLDLWTARTALKASIRQFFADREFIEIDTPIVVAAPGVETHLDYFATTWIDHSNQSHPLYLRSSPELHMKRALCHGARRIFQIAPCFRNGGEHSAWHHPEFTMLEWYEAGLSYTGLMQQTEELLRETQQAVTSTCKIANAWRLPASIPRLTVGEAFKNFANIDLIDQDQELAAKARSLGYQSVRAYDDFATAFFKILIDKIEPELAHFPAVILYDYPASMAVLAQVSQGVAQRFELYVGRVELCNAFAESTDPVENQKRWELSNLQRQALGKPAIAVDNDFISNLRQGLPNCSGNALGFDRWLALILGHQDISQVIPFRQ